MLFSFLFLNVLDSVPDSIKFHPHCCRFNVRLRGGNSNITELSTTHCVIKKWISCVLPLQEPLKLVNFVCIQSPTLLSGTLPKKNEESISATNSNTRYNNVHQKASNASTQCDVVDPKVTAPTLCAMLHSDQSALDSFLGLAMNV